MKSSQVSFPFDGKKTFQRCYYRYYQGGHTHYGLPVHSSDKTIEIKAILPTFSLILGLEEVPAMTIHMKGVVLTA